MYKRQPLLRFGWEVIAVNRSNKRAIKIAEEFLTKEEVKNVHFIEIDLSNLDDVRKGCDEILERFKKPINSLICNAAVYKPRLKEIEDSFSYEKYRFNVLTNKFDNLFSFEGEQSFMKDQDQIISRDIIRVIWR